MSEWISVKDGAPPEGAFAWICHPCEWDGVHLAVYEKGAFVSFDDDHDTFHDVIYWQPIPLPPASAWIGRDGRRPGGPSGDCFLVCGDKLDYGIHVATFYDATCDLFGNAFRWLDWASWMPLVKPGPPNA